MPIAEQIYFHRSPRGPAGRHTPTVVRSLGIWKFSSNIDAAKEFIKFHFNTENYSETKDAIAWAEGEVKRIYGS